MDKNEKLSQAIIDLIEAYSMLEDALEEKHPDDEDAYSQSLIDAVETAIDTGIEEHGSNTSAFAGLVSVMTEALEQLDPSAFDEDDEIEEEYVMQDIDLDEDEDLDLDEEEDDD